MTSPLIDLSRLTSEPSNDFGPTGFGCHSFTDPLAALQANCLFVFQQAFSLQFSLHIDFRRIFAYACFWHGLPGSKSKAVRRYLQAVPARRAVRRSRVSFPIDSGHLPSLRRATKISTFRSFPRPPKSSRYEAGSNRGTLRCSTQTQLSPAQTGP
jgi:hypothetical protein